MTPEQFEEHYGHRYLLTEVKHFKRIDRVHVIVANGKNKGLRISLTLKCRLIDLPVDGFDWILLKADKLEAQA